MSLSDTDDANIHCTVVAYRIWKWGGEHRVYVADITVTVLQENCEGDLLFDSVLLAPPIHHVSDHGNREQNIVASELNDPI